MTSYSDIVGKEPELSRESEPVLGDFLCTVCSESSEKAIFYPDEKILAWKCSKGHNSVIKDVPL